MNWGPSEQIDRTSKILIDAGLVSNPAEAGDYLAGLILQVAVGPDIATDAAAQAALATAVNAGARAFRGGVHVLLQRDAELTTGWTKGLSASTVVTTYGGLVVDRHDADRPTLVIGGATGVGEALHVSYVGWSAGVVQESISVQGGRANALAGVVSAAMGVSELFQQALGDVVTGRRDVGVSLWRPDLPWQAPEAAGPDLAFLPADLWLLGLGHLGQAYAWVLGMLPYATPGDVTVGLVDFDTLEAGNTATQLLSHARDVGEHKTRIVSRALERNGFATRIVERAYDEHFRAVSHGSRARNEPAIALAGFDALAPRQDLDSGGFQRVVDGALGNGPVEYLDILVQSLPGSRSSREMFAPAARQVTRHVSPAYEAEVSRQVAAGVPEATARCGMVDIAGVTVGAAFVGVVAAALVIADVLRLLHDEGFDYAIVSLDLRSPEHVRAVVRTEPGHVITPSFTEASSALGHGEPR